MKKEKRNICNFITIIILLLSILVNIHTANPVSEPIEIESLGDILHVPDDYPTIQAAINNAPYNTKIIVSRGLYMKNINVNQTVKLIGNGTMGTIIRGDQKSDVVTITSDGVEINGFTIENSGHINAGIKINSQLNIIDSCYITNNGYGIELSFTNCNQITNNIIKDNSKSGLWIYYSVENDIRGNEILDNKNGMLVNFSSHYNHIDGNIFSNNDKDGVEFSESSRGNKFIANSVNNNNEHGLKIIGSSDSNDIHHNDMVNNNLNALDTSSNNWNDTIQASGEGNFWSDYTGVDSDGDGIGDTPYIIASENSSLSAYKGNQDNFPLMDSNIPSELKIEVLNYGEIKTNEEIEFEVTFRHKMDNSLNPLEDEIYCEINWDDQTDNHESLIDQEGLYITHTWGDEGEYKIRVRSYHFVAGKKFSSSWFVHPLDIKEKTKTRQPGIFICKNFEIIPVKNEVSTGIKISISGVGLFRPEIGIIHSYETETSLVDTYYWSSEYDRPFSGFLFFWNKKVIEERYFTTSSIRDINAILTINGKQVKKITSTII